MQERPSLNNFPAIVFKRCVLPRLTCSRTRNYKALRFYKGIRSHRDLLTPVLR
uniref:Uncharacterized protein n=1 Tax=Anguilla anguilla TaxID=7936 RepID=A0A0E9PZP7_ANGAN